MAGSEKSEDIDDKIYEIFDELQKSLELNQKFHPSEEIGKTYGKHLPSYQPHIIINKYHSYCPTCNDHFYSQSLLNDINSFFQKHMNTKYHKAKRLLSSISETESIFKWEKWLSTGYCNICEMSGIHAFIIETSESSKRLAETHDCKYEQRIVDNYFRYLKKIEKFKLYCSLSVFNEKFLKNYGECTICFLCTEVLFGAREKNLYHLATDDHFSSFCSFIVKTFNLTIKDLFNGFYLEQVTRWIVNNDFKKNYSVKKIYNDREKCLEESNNSVNPYSKRLAYSGFSPKFVESLGHVKNDTCSVCHEKKTDKTGKSGSREIDVCVHTHQNNTKIYKDLQEAYTKLKLELSIYGLKIGMDYKPEFDGKILKSIPFISCNKEFRKCKTFPWTISDTKDLVKEKLRFLKDIFSKINGKLFCEYCENFIPYKHKLVHVEEKSHKLSVSTWNELLIKINNPNFFEPLRKINYDFICFACKTHFHENDVFLHLRDVKHSQSVDSITDSSRRTIWTNFEFMTNYSCYCQKCDAEISGKGSNSKLKTIISNVFNHWPCSGEQVKVQETSSDSEGSVLVTSNSESASDSSKSESFDFLNYQKTLRNLTEVFEDKIIEHVKSNLNKNKEKNVSENKNTNNTTSDKKCTPEKEMTESGSIQSLSVSVSATLGETSEEASPVFMQPNGVRNTDSINDELVENTLSEVKNLTLEVQNLNIEGKNLSENTTQKEEPPDNRNKYEELILFDVPKEKSLRRRILAWLKNFGEVKYLLFKENTAVVGFVLKGVAEEVAKKETIPIGKQGIKMDFQLRTDTKDEKYRYPPLNKFITNLLLDVDQLMDYTSDLLLQSIKINESPKEKMREEILCNTIIKVLMFNYPFSKCYPFGSRLSGLTLSNSDLDVFLDCGDMYEGLKTPKSERDFVNQIAHIFRGSGEFKQLIVVDRARVPIISFQHKSTNLNCDLSFKNAISVQNTFLLRYMVSVDPRIKPIILFLKRWADLNCFHGPPYFSSYALAMMVIFYLQQPPDPILPKIETLKLNFVGRRMTIGGWDCNFSTDASLIPPKTNTSTLPKLLLGFFKFYAEFEYSKYIISPLTGEPLLRDAFSESSNFKLPMSIKRHVMNIPPPLKNLVEPDFAICIMDPFDLSHILTKNFPKRAHGIFVHLCKKSAENLEKGLETV